jgi:hypothetical protein
MGKRKNIKKAVKAQVEEEARQQQQNVKNLDIEANLEDVMSIDTKEGGMTKKEKRQEVKKRVKAAKSKVLRTGPIKKTIPADAKGLLSMVQTTQGKDVVKNRFDYTKMPDGSSIIRKCSYNSKRK